MIDGWKRSLDGWNLKMSKVEKFCVAIFVTAKVSLIDASISRLRRTQLRDDRAYLSRKAGGLTCSRRDACSCKTLARLGAARCKAKLLSHGFLLAVDLSLLGCGFHNIHVVAVPKKDSLCFAGINRIPRSDDRPCFSLA